MKRTLASMLNYLEDGIHYLDDLPFTGIAFTVTKEGFQKSEMEYKEGLLSGRTREWYAPEVPMVDANYLNGVLHGAAREWHKNGQIAEAGTYEYGIVLWEREWEKEWEPNTRLYT